MKKINFIDGKECTLSNGNLPLGSLPWNIGYDN